MGDESHPKFKVKGWISAEDFKKLLTFADYLGRERGCSLFRISKDKVLGRGITTDEVLETLDDLGVFYGEELIRFLESVTASRRGDATLSFDGEKVWVKFSSFLGNLYREKLSDVLNYDKNSKMFYTYPMHYGDLLRRLEGLGFQINDLTGFMLNEPLSSKPLVFKGELRDYQKEALDSWEGNASKGIVALPTGSGKTVIGVAALARKSVKTLIIVYTKEQMMQWKRAILNFTDADEYLIGFYYSREKRIAPITLATYQTAYRYMGKLAPHFTLLIIDEVHHLPAEKFRYIASASPAPYRLGLSATPYREDGGHTYLFPLMGGVIYYKTPSELAEKGYLARYRVITVKVDLTPEERKEYLRLREQFRNFSGLRPFEEIVKAAKKGDFRAINALRVHSRMTQIFQKSDSKLRKVREIVLNELREGKKIIVFAHYVDLAKKIAEDVGGYLLTGATPDQERRRILEEFRGAKSGVLVVTTVGDEGLDIPDASVGVLVAGTGSRRQFIQRLGRLLRPGEGKEAVLYEIVAKGTVEEGQARKRKRVRLDNLADVEKRTEK
ncbi:MAG: DEAD/DEAH box helicase [Desulfurococcales archaeon]|nr:DEAD/DEAH box helicase [Desulfurococcales archaeon]